MISPWKLFFATRFLYLACALKFFSEVEYRLFMNWISCQIYMTPLCQLTACCFWTRTKDKMDKIKISECNFVFVFFFPYLYDIYIHYCFLLFIWASIVFIAFLFASLFSFLSCFLHFLFLYLIFYYSLFFSLSLFFSWILALRFWCPITNGYRNEFWLVLAPG